MARKAGPIEQELMKAVRVYLQKHGHGAATKLGKAIGLRSAWIAGFAVGDRRAYIDDAAKIAHELDIDIRALANERYKAAEDTTPVDRREVLMARMFARIKDDQCRRAAIVAVRSLMEIDADIRGEKKEFNGEDVEAADQDHASRRAG